MHLITERLQLRVLAEDDLPTFAAYRSDPAIARYQGWETPYTLAQATALWQEIYSQPPGTPGAWCQLALERRDAPGLIGDCAFQVLADDPQQAQIGYTLATAFHGQGYATEAVRGLLAHFFGAWQLHRVSATCLADNQASWRVLERVGMRREAHWVQAVWLNGEWVDELGYAVLRREWAARQP